MKSAIVFSLAVSVALAALPAVAGAYSGSSNGSISGLTMPSSVNLPSLPTGLFNNLNWTSFLNTLPIQGFVSSLQSSANSIGTHVAGSSMSVPNVNLSASHDSTILQGVDDWTSAHLGFRISGFILGALGIFSWMLGAVKIGIDWLIGFLR